MSESLHRALDALIAQRADTIDPDQIQLSPHYGEAYAETVNLAAGLDFNFIFHWGPRLEPYERIVIEVLVYIARETARQSAMQSMKIGQREADVQIYLERVPASAPQTASPDCLRQSLTDLTNLDRKKVYAALKSPNVAAFITREPTTRIHKNGRVITPPARFKVRVDPVPTPEQIQAIRSKIAERIVAGQLSSTLAAVNQPLTNQPHQEPLHLNTHPDTSPMAQLGTSLMSPCEPSVTYPSETSPNRQEAASSDTSGIPPYVLKMMSLKEMSNVNPPESSNGHIDDGTSRRPPQIRLVSVSEENPKDRIDSESRSRGSETDPVTNESFDAWKQETANLARHSASQLRDVGAFGWHICLWNHARKVDRSTGKTTLTDGLFAILRSLTEKADQSQKPQGPAWTRRAQRLFEDNGVPMTANWSAESADEEELAAVRSALSAAPFMQRVFTPQASTENGNISK